MKRLRLTPDLNSTSGAAWFRYKQPVAFGFDTSFGFQFTTGQPNKEAGEPGAEQSPPGFSTDGFANAEAHYALAAALEQSGALAEARRHLAEARKLGKRPTAAERAQ